MYVNEIINRGSLESRVTGDFDELPGKIFEHNLEGRATEQHCHLT